MSSYQKTLNTLVNSTLNQSQSIILMSLQDDEHPHKKNNNINMPHAWDYPLKNSMDKLNRGSYVGFDSDQIQRIRVSQFLCNSTPASTKFKHHRNNSQDSPANFWRLNKKIAADYSKNSMQQSQRKDHRHSHVGPNKKIISEYLHMRNSQSGGKNDSYFNSL